MSRKVLMSLIGSMRPMGLMGPMERLLLTFSFIIFHLSFSVAQIKIGGNVYGGGNHAEVKGSTKVTVKAGDIGAVIDPDAKRPLEDPRGRVFGGARMANVGGNTFVHIDGENATDYIVVNQVYGGNDIAGHIGTASDVRETVPTELTAVKTDPADDDPKKNAVDSTFNSYVRVSTKVGTPAVYYTAEEIAAAATNSPAWGKTVNHVKTAAVPAADAKKVYIGQLFGGGNGDYYYEQSTANGKTTHYIYSKDPAEGGTLVETIVTDEGKVGFQVPEIDSTYLEVVGGSIVYAYGGGNNATVKEHTLIHVDNPSAVVNHIYVDEDGVESTTATETSHEGYTDLLTNERFLEMGINTTFSKPSSGEFQIGRFFGGNNLATMDIMPSWNLLGGKIRDLYSGGNRGMMTSPKGLLLEIPAISTLVADNIFGGCRMADVKPLVNGEYIPVTNLPGYYFPNELAARVLVRGGDVNNVYGGNDVTGTVYGGNAVGIYASVRGNVYGGGNGAYPYTDGDGFKNDATFGDLYYSLESDGYSPRALNAFRPNAEQVSIRLAGTDAMHPTIVRGAIYCGGNCASIATKKPNPLLELKIGSHVIADQVFLGNNGAEMVDPTILKQYATAGFTTINMTSKTDFADYMEGVAMNLQPRITFDQTANGDPANYEEYSSYVGSFFCGGNVGSMSIPGKNTYSISHKLNIFDKFVGGCNNAYVAEQFAEDGTKLNAIYDGGVLGSASERPTYTDGDNNVKDRLEINLENLTITPLRWNNPLTKQYLIWNTNKWQTVYTAVEKGTTLTAGETYYTSETGDGEFTATADQKADASTYEKGEDFVAVARDPSDHDIRLLEGNVYGGCYNSGHVNGNVVININEDVMQRSEIFGTGPSRYGKVASGVELKDQRDDEMAVALSVFGGGCGEGTEIWGSSTVNLNNGYTFQIFGGGEEGIVGRKKFDVNGDPVLDEDEHFVYEYDPRYSAIVNLNGTTPVYSSTDVAENLAETEYIYGGGSEGDVCGNTYVNLGNGRIYDAFGGASDADILGHTEVYIGRQPNGSGGYKDGFPWVRDIVYGGNDFGGTIHGAYEDDYNFEARLRNYATDKTSLHGTPTNGAPGLLQSSSYVAYLQGRVDTIFGGGYGCYNYTLDKYEGASMPYQASSFVNIRPKTHDQNALKGVFGGGTGYPKEREGDKSQDRSYVLIDIPDGMTKFAATEVFGAGAYNGLGMRYTKAETTAEAFKLDQASAIIDLLHGQVGNAYGGSFNEGNTRRTVINVPALSTIKIGNIFGGAYGTQILPSCDVYESHVNYNNTSENARVTGNIYGGNDSERRTLYTQVNISSPVWSNKEKGYLARVYGAGKGIDTWSEYTEVNLNKGAKVYEVYGGGEMGHVLNAESVQKYMDLYKSKPSAQISAQDPLWSKAERWDGAVGTGTIKAAYADKWASDWKDAWTFGDYYEPNADFSNYVGNAVTNLTNTVLVKTAGMDDRDYSGYTTEEKAKRQYRYNTNVLINEGATVVNYAYGGGLGDASVHLSGDIYGSTYIALLGGTVNKDIYAACTSGSVDDVFDVGAYNASTNTTGFTATANAYVKGGTCRNVYGGGWKGDVGAHIDPSTHTTTNDITIAPTNDIPGETHVVIGDIGGTSFTNGIPAIQRNAYGGGEGEASDGGMIFGTTHLTLNNGYIGYAYNAEGTDDSETTDFDERYEEKIEDETKTMPNTWLSEAGCLFGGGYTDNSYVDKTVVNIFGGHVRNSAFGGGEVAAIGRGDMKAKAGGSDYELKGIYRPGKTLIEMFGGHVYQNVYGGGRGYNNLNEVGSLHSSGFVFGQTEVHIHGGEIGTMAGVADGDGNVFGGGDVGHVYSALEADDGTFYKGVKIGQRYADAHQGYYFKHSWADTGEGSGFIMDGKENIFTEDCKVVVEPNLKVTSPVTINGHRYAIGDYVPIDDLNTLKNKVTDADTWACLDASGIIIHNAVFAGGNMPSGALATSANTASVFGNATASVHDIYHRDMITLGTRHTGGLYGDGNLTLVDGYRELNITNYGTDYYSIAKEISIGDYKKLPKREADYYELRYTCIKDCQDKDGTHYKKETTGDDGITIKASTITADEMQNLFVEEKDGKKVSVKDGSTDILVWDAAEGEWVPNTAEGANYWKESGVLPVYAGRLMNSIQRADFCGVFGSRMVMQGAKDRVPEEANYTNYTINRVREVSLNQMHSKIESDLTLKPGKVKAAKVEDQDADDYVDKEKAIHGNYFGIYNIVNYLGALTSDVRFTDVRKTESNNEDTHKCAAGGKAYETATYYDWKKAFHNDRRRNNGSSHNKVALASGVYLELTTEESTGDGLYEKVWGPITGIIELDLINVSTGIGGGFVYAKNQHGVSTASGHSNTTLTALNKDAVTQWDYNYNTTEDSEHQMEWETSGNFVHSTQTIIDDCYNISNRYMGTGKMPAHFWYIKGSTYVYDQYISAYTGTTNAFSETVDIPLTLTAASHGRMKLLNVQPNLYAYYATPGVKLESGKRILINGKSYYLNDPISYWDWFLLSKSEKDLFVPKTYTNCVTYKLNGEEHEAGSVIMSQAEFDAFKSAGHVYKNADDEDIKKADNSAADDDYIFRLSNNVSHDTGYLLTYELNNPSQWDNWYTLKSGEYKAKKTQAEYQKMDAVTKATYYDGPTYRLDETKVTGDGILLGQRTYKEGELIAEDIYTTYQAVKTSHASAIPSGQAEFVPAYLVTEKITVTNPSTGRETHYNEGVAVSKAFADAHSSSTEAAYLCTKSIQVSKEEVIYKDTKLTATERTSYIDDVKGKMETVSSGAGTMTIDAINASGTLTAAQKKQLTELATLRDDLTNNIVPAYYCASADGGLYGGNYYEKNQNYRGLEAWSSLTAADHDKFIFNYDALDLLIDPNYTTAKSGAYSEGQKYQYDGDYDSEAAVRDADTGNKAGYSVQQSVDYTASYNDAKHTLSVAEMTVNRGGTPTTTTSLQDGDELTRDQYEGLPNEQRYYSPIAVKHDVETYYVVHTAFQVGSTPYAVGETISAESYTSLPSTEKGYITQLKFPAAHEDQTIYYCRESYKGNTEVNAIASSTVTNAVAHTDGAKSVAQGTVISSTQYAALPNDQKHFTIHGVSPTETSTLYVSRESNIYDLSKEKIITVVYQYDYDETDGSGNVTPISERHVVNIHLTFRSGVPTVEDISKPEIILPGNYITLREPTVTPGAYEIAGGGWELFETQRDAESHSNGVDFTPNFDPLYWYQDGYYVAYYAKSYLGRTYSNAVPVSVANYHDLADVMSDENKEHHMYIDNANVKREPKIYINDYTGSGKNGLEYFKNLFDLSVLDGSPVDGYTFSDGKITATAAPANKALTNHTLLNSRVKGGENLEFFLRTDITVPSGSPAWTPIGTDAQCFEGTLHGDGHTISGLDHSLFYNLCGSVYNLGVTGSFNTAGVVDKGTGYVESSWVKSTNATPLDTKPYPVFGNPSSGSGYQLVNSYYSQANAALYNTDNNARGTATQMVDDAFYNGEVAYDLNNFYLHKRYSDKKVSSGNEYKYLLPGVTDPETGKLIPQTGHYADKADLCSSGYTYKPEGATESVTLTYVEDRFADGDFRYADGTIPSTDDERYWIEVSTDPETGKDVETDCFSPLWPDDYIFFGQKLTYGWAAQAHQEVPTAVVRDGGRLSLDDDANRVYRAPAYYRNSTMNVAHFNPDAYLAQKSYDGTKEAHPNMTAIDFAGHNDITKPYQMGWNDNWFYPPLLDDDGLTSIENCDETKNLLVYAPSTDANAQTLGVLTDYFTEPVYADHYDNSDGYRLVAEANASSVHGHLVQSGLTATNDHLLVDKQDFNAPLAYTFDSDHLMWYQRTPANSEYVDHTKGWQGISVPFTAELVTTHQKGEITHFYSGSTSSANGTGTKIGHEYWLREFNAITASGEPEVAKATFAYPIAGDGFPVTTKTVTNDFLWDYYYKNEPVHNQQDANADTYLQYRQYYKDARTYNRYPMLTAATPYILGLPGQTYYEFDLSGNFTAENTAVSISKLGKQVITLASSKGIAIGVSDNEMTGKKVTYNGTDYIFKPSYMNEQLENGNYVMNTAGDAYHKLDDSGTGKYNTTGSRYVDADAFAAAGTLYTDAEGTTEAVSWADATTTYYTRVSEITNNEAHNVTPSLTAFRPYFTAMVSGAGARRNVPSRIVFGGANGEEFEQGPESVLDGSIEFYVRGRSIVAVSHRREPTAVRIVNVAGITLRDFVIESGQTVETPVSLPGIYMANRKKLFVK